MQSFARQPDNLGSFQFACWHLSRMKQLFYGCVFFLGQFSQSQSHIPSLLLPLEIPFYIIPYLADAPIEDGFVNPFQDDSHHLLDQFIIPRRDTQWALLAIFLRDIGPANRLKTIGSAFESRDDGRDPFFREPIQRDLIYAWRRCPFVGIDVGVSFMPQDRVFQQSEYPIDRFPLF